MSELSYTNVPSDPEELQAFLVDILRQLEQILGEVHIVPVQHVEPDRLYEGMLVFADGTDWDPGSGRGFYYYDAGWVQL